jgi:hypothetical protein
MLCEKKTFETKQEALDRLKEIRESEGDHRKPIRVYVCDKCHKFHLTSFTKGMQRKVKRIKVIKHINKLEREAEFWIKRKQWKDE